MLLEGDKVLQCISKTIKENSRNSDTIGMAGCKTTMRMADKVDITNDGLRIHVGLVEICLIEMTHSGILGEV